MNDHEGLASARRIGTGSAFIIFPLVFVFAFANHPGLLNPHFLGPAELILRARNNGVLQFGHALVTLNTALLLVVALHFMKLLDRGPAAWAGFVGGGLAVVGALMLAADKGALCLTMSALDTLPDGEFARMMPGLLAMFAKQGWLVLLWGILLLPVGFGIQAVALLQSRTLPRWQRPVPGGRPAGGHPGWRRDRQSERIHPPGDRIRPLWDEDHRPAAKPRRPFGPRAACAIVPPLLSSDPRFTTPNGGTRPMPAPTPPRDAARRTLSWLLALALAIALVAPAAAAPKAAPKVATAKAQVAPPARTGLENLEKQVKEFTLPNGLKFIVVERHNAPVFSFETMVNAGGADEQVGQTGIAHMMEHMAFKGTAVVGTKDWAKEKPLLDAEETRLAGAAERAPQAACAPTPRALAALQKAFSEAQEAARAAGRVERVLAHHRGRGRPGHERRDQRRRHPLLLLAALEPAGAVGADGRRPHGQPGVPGVLQGARRRLRRAPHGRRVLADRAAVHGLPQHRLRGASLQDRRDRLPVRSEELQPHAGRPVLPRALHGEEHGRRGGGRRHRAGAAGARHRSTSAGSPTPRRRRRWTPRSPSSRPSTASSSRTRRSR